MARRHADTIEVRHRDDAPEQFLWRERVYVVRQVLAHWVEAGQWWSAAGASALLAGEPAASAPDSGTGALATAPIPPSPKWAQRAWGEPAPDVGAATGPMQLDDGEREMWRVEATAGYAGTDGTAGYAGTGVYDLCFDWSRGAWRLTRVTD